MQRLIHAEFVMTGYLHLTLPAGRRVAAAVPHGESGGLTSAVAWIQSNSREGHRLLRHLLLHLGYPGTAGA